MNEHSRQKQALVNSNDGVPSSEHYEVRNVFLSGIKQRLLSFIFRAIWNEEVDETQVSLFAYH